MHTCICVPLVAFHIHAVQSLDPATSTFPCQCAGAVTSMQFGAAGGYLRMPVNPGNILTWPFQSLHQAAIFHPPNLQPRVTCCSWPAESMLTITRASSPPVATKVPSRLNLIHAIESVCPVSICKHSPVLVSQILATSSPGNSSSEKEVRAS